MKKILFFLFVSFFLNSSESRAQELDLPNNFTPSNVTPEGCLLLTPSSASAPPEVTFFDQNFEIDESPVFSSTWRIRVWRIGCHEPNRSLIAVNLKLVSANSTFLNMPRAFLTVPGSTDQIPVFLDLHSAANGPSELMGRLGGSLTTLATISTWVDGVTLIVDSLASGISPSQYNDDILLTLEFIDNQVIQIPIFSYDADLDPTQLSLAAFHGRYSGQWVVEGLPSSGLLLQIGEVPTTNRNFIFAIWFTYIDGVPTWVVGNRDFEIGSNEIALDMVLVEGGGFFTDPGSFTRDDISVSQIGTMTIRAKHCNEIEADVDLTSSGLGASNLTFNRLIRIAGYDCDQTQ